MVACVGALNERTRFSSLPLGGNEADITANQVCLWQTGFPVRTSFAGGLIDHDADRYALEALLAHDEIDALVWISSFDAALAPPPSRIPTIVLGRGGMIVIGGDVGDYCAARMIAGTIVVRGGAGRGIGFAMRRGTLLVARVAELPATFADGGPPPHVFLRLLKRYLRDAGAPLESFAQMTEEVRRFVGDRACAGLGEILVAQ